MRNVCGLDVHKDSVFMCILKENGEKIEIKFDVLTPSLDTMCDILTHHEVQEVAMESTSIYWIPIWRILCESFDVKLVNPYFIKQLPGRKTDVKDAHWIALVLQKELVKGSFVPDPLIQELRQYGRCISRIKRNLVRSEQNIDMILQRCNIRLSNYVSNVKGKSMQKVVRAIINGESDPDVLVELIHKRTINKHGKSIIRDSLSGVISGADRMMLRIAREEMDMYERQVEECYVEMNKICDEHFSEELELLTTIPGVKEDSAVRIIAEIGTDMEAFASSASLVSWAGLRPRNEESAGRIKGRKTLHGNKYLRVLLVQCAWGASRTLSSKFHIRYNSLHKRMNHNKALLANARKLLVVIWNILKYKQPYQPLVKAA